VTPLRCVALLFVAALGCAPTAAYVAARKAEETASVTVEASYRTWRDYDRAHQEQLVEQAGDLETARGMLAQYRSGVQTKVDEAFITARNAVSAMDQLLGAAGAVTVKDYSTAIARLLGALAMLGSILAEYNVTVPLPAPKPTALQLWRFGDSVVGFAHAEVTDGR
jgi:hypothetical protein